MKFLARVTDHELSIRVLGAFAEGTPLTCRSGVGGDLWKDEIPVYYGILRGCGEAIKEDMKAGRPWVYIDHGYFTGDYYRMVVGGLHHRIPENPKPANNSSGMTFAPLRDEPGGPMILVPPSAAVADFYGIGIEDWIGRCLSVFPSAAVSTKAMGNLSVLMESCRGLVTHSSQAAVKALTMGIPAWCTAERAPVPNHGIYDRADLLGWLVERQFTLKDIESGRHLGHLEREIKAYAGWNSSGKAAQASPSCPAE